MSNGVVRHPMLDNLEKLPATLLILLILCFFSHNSVAEPKQFIIFNISSGNGTDAFEYIHQQRQDGQDSPVAAGVGLIFSYLAKARPEIEADLKLFLDRSSEMNVPIVVQLDGENWWGGRPDLWNWWDTNRPGYSDHNRTNVEWTSWSQADAIKIAWRNWGSQIRVLPPPNLMSRAYRGAVHEEMRVLIPLVLNWWKKLPANRKHLLVGIKLGWESSIGVNAWHYPHGNEMLDHPASSDPTGGLAASELPARGVAQIGYAGVKTAGIRTDGKIQEADLAEVVRRHLFDLCRLAGELGVPRDRLFTHIAGWKSGEMLYHSGTNAFSCPGWSFYQHAADPSKDVGVQAALKRSDAPYWAAVEWLYQGPRKLDPWRDAMANTLAQPNCRYLCIYNWEAVRADKEIMSAVQSLTRGR